MLLRQNPHNLYYILIRFEALGLPVGSLDTPIPIAARPTSYFSFVAASSTPNKDKDDTMSMSSMRSRISVVSSSFSSSLSWFGSSSKPDPSKDVKYIYSCFTKIPSLRLGPIPARKLIQDFEDCPGQSSVPLDVFKNLQVLELDDVDPRTLLGWDRCSLGLRSLTVKKSGMEDVTDLLVDLVIVDERRRRGDKVDLNQLRRSKSTSHDLSSSDLTETTGTNTDTEEPPTTTATTALVKELPSLAWHSLRHLNLSSNNLTFIPAEPLGPLTALTHLDLSSNLLNTVPPSLVHLQSLVSLNISDNLIDSVLGIYDALPWIQVLNLAKNRLESLCGLERLYTLQRIDLRSNAIYEPGEVGRLAPLRKVKEVWVKDNPLVEEEMDWRVEVFVEFVKEGRWVVLDGEEVGYWEKQRVMERVPGVERLLADGKGANSSTNVGTIRGGRKTSEEEAQLAKDVATTSNSIVVVKKHRTADRGRSNPLSLEQREGVERSRSGSRAAVGKRRNQRVVELDSSPQKQTLTESDKIKQAALSGNNTAAIDGPVPSSSTSQQTGAKRSPMDNGTLTWSRKSGASIAQLSSTQDSSAAAIPSEKLPNTLGRKSPTDLFSTTQNEVEVRQRIPRPRTASATALARRSTVTASLYNPDLHPPLPPSSSSFIPESSTESRGEGVSNNKSEELRKRIEALKSEVGDDWLRILAAEGGNRDSVMLRGESETQTERLGGGEQKEEERRVQGRRSKKKLRDEQGASLAGRRREAKIS